MTADDQAPVPIPASAWKRYASAIVGCTLVVFATGVPHAGFVLVYVVMALAIWLLVSIVTVLRRRTELRPKSILLGIWIATIAGVLGLHWHYAEDARSRANGYVRVIERYRSDHGAYPPDAASAGLESRKAPYFLDYMLDDGKPTLRYSATFTMLDAYNYDFDRHAWEYQPD
jgi:hypothetical protein